MHRLMEKFETNWMAPRVIVDTYPRACAHGVQRLAQLTALFAYHYKYRQLGSKLLIERNTKASMMMGKSSPSTSPVYAVAAALLLVYLMVAMGAGVVEAAVVPPSRCNPTLLTPCAGPALFGGPVPPACCAQLRAQAACLCAYARSPNYGSYIRSPNARRLFAVCGLPMPRCS